MAERMIAALKRPKPSQARAAPSAARASSASRTARAQPRSGGPVGRTAPSRVRLLLGRARLHFFGDALAELRKVTWPTRQQAQNLTLVVLAVSVGVGLVLGGMDYVFEKLFQAVLQTR